MLAIYVDKFTVAFERTPLHRTSYYNCTGWIVCCLQSTTIRCPLVRSIQPSHPGVLASIFTIFCTARNAKGIRMTPISVGLSSRPQDRYIVARRSPRSMSRRLPSAVVSWNVLRRFFCDERPHDVNYKWPLASPPA